MTSTENPTAAANPAANAIAMAADRILKAYAFGEPCDPVRDLIHNVDDAYAVQDLLTTKALADGRRLVGRKIGLTSAAVQQQLGVDSPDFGMLFADMAVPDGEEIPVGAVSQPKA